MSSQGDGLSYFELWRSWLERSLVGIGSVGLMIGNFSQCTLGGGSPNVDVEFQVSGPSALSFQLDGVEVCSRHLTKSVDGSLFGSFSLSD